MTWVAFSPAVVRSPPAGGTAWRRLPKQGSGVRGQEPPITLFVPSSVGLYRSVGLPPAALPARPLQGAHCVGAAAEQDVVGYPWSPTSGPSPPRKGPRRKSTRSAPRNRADALSFDRRTFYRPPVRVAGRTRRIFRSKCKLGIVSSGRGHSRAGRTFRGTGRRAAGFSLRGSARGSRPPARG